MINNPKWLSEDLHEHAQQLSQAMDAQLRARATPPNRYERVFDDGAFMLFRCCPPARGGLNYEAFELRFSPDNARPDPQALVRMGAALAHLRSENVLIGDENEANDVSVSLTATPATTPEMLRRQYDEQRAEFKGSALMHHAHIDVLAQKFGTLPPHHLVCESCDGKVHEYTLTFTRSMAPEAIKQIGERIAGWCNEADAGTNECMHSLRETLHISSAPDTYHVVAGPSYDGSKHALTVMVPEGFTYSSMALAKHCKQANCRSM